MSVLERLTTTSLRMLATSLLLTGFACGDDDSDPNGGTADASVTPDTGPADTGTVDMGPVDTGVLPACNPVDGSGCPAADEFCVLDFSMDRGSCRLLPDMLDRGQECSSALLNCAPGLSCVSLEQGTPPTCRQACRQGGSDCDSIDPDEAFVCVGGQDNTYGVCVGTGGSACDPLANPSDCVLGEVCTSVPGTFETVCAPAGGTQLNGDCSMNNCAQGQGICLTVSGQSSCFEPCDLTNRICNQPDALCFTIGNETMSYAFGACVPQTPCDPVNPMCGAGETCSLLNGRPFCWAAGDAQLGQACDINNNNCAEGQGICINLMGTGQLCFEACAAMGGMCPAGQMCNGLQGLNFGICQ